MQRKRSHNGLVRSWLLIRLFFFSTMLRRMRPPPSGRVAKHLLISEAFVLAILVVPALDKTLPKQHKTAKVKKAELLSRLLPKHPLRVTVCARW